MSSHYHQGFCHLPRKLNRHIVAMCSVRMTSCHVHKSRKNIVFMNCEFTPTSLWYASYINELLHM